MKKKKHMELTRKKELQVRNKNVDGKVILNVNLDVDVGMSRVDDVEALIFEPLNWFGISFFFILFCFGKRLNEIHV